MGNWILKSNRWINKHIHHRDAENPTYDLGAFESVLYQFCLLNSHPALRSGFWVKCKIWV